ncbi:hypothetical protein ACLOJK_014286 [Asimina triloba]
MARPRIAPTLLLSILLFSSLAHIIDAAGYGPPVIGPPAVAPAPGPAFEVAGKNFPPQSFLCNNKSSPCLGKTIKCPKQCPEFNPADPKAKACFIDCSSPKCEAVCRNRKPNCEGIGAACYDPRFVGGDGIVFYFHGKSNHHFCLVSDPNLHINARFIGRRPEGRSRDNTWIQALGFMFDSHTFSLAAKKVARWDDKLDQLLFAYDGVPLLIHESHRSSWSAPDSSLTVQRIAKANSVTVVIPNVVDISVSVVPITKEDDRVHNYQIPNDDCFAHLEVQFRFLDLSERVEGVLGQTYRPDFQNPVKRGVSMPIMGGEDRYQTSGLLSADCKYCIFSQQKDAAATTQSLVLDPSNTMDCTSKLTNGRGLVCRR